MPQLLTLPYAVPLSAVGALLPGAKLSFFQTGTSTPQAVYTDVGLSVAHSQPVVANAAGRFAAIYLDPSQPNYRILLTDSADVTQPGYPIDNVPSTQNTTQQFRLKHTAPELIFEETDASAGNQKWRIRVNSEQFLIDLLNDAESSSANIAAMTRNGQTPGSLNFAGQYLQVAGNNVATQQNTSTEAATLTGVDAVVTGTVQFRRSGTKVSIYFPSTISGTSNTTAMTLTGLGVLNATTGGIVLCRVIDNGTIVLGTASIGTSSITFGVGAASGNFTGSGTKGIPSGTLIVYDTDSAGIA